MRVKFGVDIRPALKGLRNFHHEIHTKAIADGLQAAAGVAVADVKKTTAFKDRTRRTRSGFVARQVLAKGRPVGQLFNKRPTAFWLERGTRKMKDRKPFIVPAAEKGTDRQLAAMGKVFERYVSKLGKAMSFDTRVGAAPLK